MFLYDFTILATDFEHVANAFRRSGAQMLSAAAVSSGSDRPQPPIVGELRPRSGALVLSVDWEHSGWDGTFMGLQGEIEFSPLDGGNTHLSVSVSWDAEGSNTYSSAEKNLRRHQAEQVIRNFVTALAQEVASHSGDQSTGS
ncbi:MAG: hypothetical protein F2894_04720 [Actinobacteria bacterium]|uniref:Unannotated protein n=1 Tax=freshwater metagenome TaxID=449393 RepID=A0A6J7QJ29_9ZZZZ|nr:hypothetical protein [Actinomycetota bacterium]MSW05496.1 hypothetical protein [Actinomycetota bacterium]MSX81890.1 hypothetical protein [Actinomycetota bacterium]